MLGIWHDFVVTLSNSDKKLSRFSTNRDENFRLLEIFLKQSEYIPNFLDDNLLIFSGRRGAKESKDACKSDRSRQELVNEYLLANISFYTAENEPYKVCQNRSVYL